MIQALLATVRQLQQICPADEDEVVMAESCGEKQQTFHSPLLKRLFAAASSSAVSEDASRLLSSLSKEAASTGDKHNLFICGSGKFPMVMTPEISAPFLLLDHVAVLLMQIFEQVEKCKAAVQAAELHLDSLLPEYRKLLRIQNLQYLSVSGNTHLIEVVSQLVSLIALITAVIKIVNTCFCCKGSSNAEGTTRLGQNLQHKEDKPLPFSRGAKSTGCSCTCKGRAYSGMQQSMAVLSCRLCFSLC